MGKKLSVMLLSTLFCACAGAGSKRAASSAGVPSGPRPDWVNGTSAEFPRDQYLLGIGIADDPASAMERARGEIARVFGTQITVASLVTASESSSRMAGGKEETSSSQDVMQAVHSTARKALEGVQIERSWRDPATGTYYSLATLKIDDALTDMDGRLIQIDKQARALKLGMETAREKLDKVKAALELRSLLKARTELVSDMHVLDPKADTDPFLRPEEYEAEADKTLGQLDVAVIMSGDGAQNVRPAVINALNKLGIDAREASSPAGADIAVECSAKFSDQADPDPSSAWKWTRGDASVSMTDVKSGKIFLSEQASAREASAVQSTARSRAEVSLGRAIAEKIRSGIDSYFSSRP